MQHVSIKVKQKFPFNCHPFSMKFAIFELTASVDIRPDRPLPDAWVAELLGVVLGV